MPASVVSLPAVVRVAVGGAVALPCRVVGVPPPRRAWETPPGADIDLPSRYCFRLGNILCFSRLNTMLFFDFAVKTLSLLRHIVFYVCTLCIRM